MIGRVVEIAEDGRHLSVARGFLVVGERGRELGRVPLDDVGVVLTNAHGLTYSNNLLLALAERGVAMVLCGPNHRPEAFLWPVSGHHAQAARMRCQLSAAAPLCKRLWQGLIRAKIRHQGVALAARGQPGEAFDLLARRVRSGDPENIEAQAARRYWPLMFGEAFRRDPGLPGVNGLLNYGYAILRSITARGVMAAGLHPSIGLHHHNRSNPLCLVDDLMEVFRPVVDLAVARLTDAGHDAVTREVKRYLALISALDLPVDRPEPDGAAAAAEVTPVSGCVARLASSVATAYETGKAELLFPRSILPVEWLAVPALEAAGSAFGTPPETSPGTPPGTPPGAPPGAPDDAAQPC